MNTEIPVETTLEKSKDNKTAELNAASDIVVKPLTDGEKESIKIRANFLNGLAIGAAIAGAFAALNTLLFSMNGIAGYNLLAIILTCIGGFFAVYFSGEFHWDARKIIAKLDGPNAKPSKEEADSFHSFNNKVRIFSLFFVVSMIIFAIFGLR